jgi:CRP-like cAMP-binding protein
MLMNASRSLSAMSSIWSEVLERGDSNPLVRRLKNLANLSAADIAALEEVSSNAFVLGSQVDLIPADAVPKDAFIVLEGLACRYRRRLTGQRQIIADLLPGDLCDVDVPSQGNMDHAVGTLSTCVVARVPHQALAELIARHPNIAHALHLTKLADVATAREWIVSLGCRSAIERMAHLFCELMARFEAVGRVQDDSCPLPLTQSDLGDMLGLSNVHVNRTLQDLRRQGLIEFKGKRLTLLKPQRLRDIAEFSPAYLQAGTQGDGHTGRAAV